MKKGTRETGRNVTGEESEAGSMTLPSQGLFVFFFFFLCFIFVFIVSIRDLFFRDYISVCLAAFGIESIRNYVRIEVLRFEF